MFRTVPSSLVATILCASCDNPAIKPSQSLVGAGEIPSAEVLSRETVYITRGVKDWGGDQLSYEWRPNDTLLVTHTFSNGGGTGVGIRGKDTLHVSHEIAAQARQLLWRVRPAKLEGVEQDVRPTGCERQGPHDFGEVIITFVNEGEASGIKDDRIGIFELPTAESCSTPTAVEARAVVRRVLQLLPKSEVAARYDRST